MLINLPFLIPFVSGIIMLFTGSYIFFQDRNNYTNKYFLGFTLSCGGWAMLTAFTFGLGNANLFLVDLNILSSIFIIPFMFFTLSNFPSSANSVPFIMKKIMAGITIILVSLLIIFPRLFIVKIVNNPSGVRAEAGQLYFVYFIILAMTSFTSLYFLHKTYKASSGRIKAQTAAGIIGLSLAIIGSIITNTLSPYLIFGGSQTWFGPPFTLIALISAAYMIYEAKDKRVKLWPIIVVASFLVLIAVWQMIVASSIENLVLSGVILIGVVLLLSFLVRDHIIENFNIEKLENLLFQVNKTNDELKKQNEIKSEFISIASHHLRTPLASIKWAISALLEGSYGKMTEAQSKLLKKLDSRNERYINFTKAFLDFSRFESGNARLDMKFSNITTLLKESVENFLPLAQKNNFEIYCNYDSSMTPDFYFDKNSMMKVFEIIIENALIYKKRDGIGRLDIAVLSDGTSVIITFTDNGIGIENEHLERIGEKFFRSDAAKKYVVEGTGLGIFIAKNIINLHNGELSIDSKKDEMTSVTIKLPIISSHPNNSDASTI